MTIDDYLISRSEAISAIKRYCEGCNNYNGVRCRSCDFDDAMTAICDCKIVDSESVRYGNWISVKDRLPEVQTPVLTLGRRGSIGIGFTTTASGTVDGRIYFYPRYGDSQPTHWMQLPDSPNEE